LNPPSGCRFRTRCPRATDVCAEIEPPFAEYAGGHLAACHHPLSVSQEEIARATRSPLSPLSAGDAMPGGREVSRDGAAGAGSGTAAPGMGGSEMAGSDAPSATEPGGQAPATDGEAQDS
ncbi:MAG: hypothetical protein JO046_19855, partial [Solirubrobacterales bacterium]|nr:hypothetical protein [Solirubrobacterales bacterium]